MAGRKVFSAGEVLQAADVNDFLMDQSVMVFAGTAARGSAIPSPTEGMVTYREDDDLVEVYNGSSFVPVGPGQILQVLSTTKTDTFTLSSTSFTDVTNLSVTVTPSLNSSKILVFASVNVNAQSTDIIGVRLLRDATVIALGDTAGNRQRGFAAPRMSNDHFQDVSTVNFLDTPNTTSSTTYKIQVNSNGGAIYVNRAHVDTDSSFFVRTVSTITVMEVAG